jgi:hypothetical protein
MKTDDYLHSGCCRPAQPRVPVVFDEHHLELLRPIYMDRVNKPTTASKSSFQEWKQEPKFQ